MISLEDEKLIKNLLFNFDGVISDVKKFYLRCIFILVVDIYIIDRYRNEKMR